MTSDIPIFVDAATRDNRVPFPTQGQQCILGDGELQIYNGPVVGWTPPWNQAWGEVAWRQLGASVAVTPSATWNPIDPRAAFIPALTVDPFVPYYHRIYTIYSDVVLTSGANGDYVQPMMIINDPQGAIFGHSQLIITQMAGVAPTPAQFFFRVAGFHYPNQAYRLGITAGQITGSGGLVWADSNRATTLRIMDEGPSGPPA